MTERHLLLLVALACSIVACSGAQKKADLAPPGCSDLYFDVGAGTLNGMDPRASMAEIKAQFPCFTGETEEGSGFNCGGGVFFLNHEFYVYTHRNYFDVRDGFKGRVSDDLLGKPRADVEAKLGKPAIEPSLYKTDYGALAVTYAHGNAVRFEAFFVPPEQVELCR